MHAHIDICDIERVSVETPIHKLPGSGYVRAIRIGRVEPIILKLFADTEDQLKIHRSAADPQSDLPFFYGDRRSERPCFFIGSHPELVIHRVSRIEVGGVRLATGGFYRGITIRADGEGYMQLNLFAKSEKSLGLALVSTDAPLPEDADIEPVGMFS